MVFQCINICQVPSEVLKTAASGLGFQHLPQDLANVNAWKTMFDPYSKYHNEEQPYRGIKWRWDEEHKPKKSQGTGSLFPNF